MRTNAMKKLNISSLNTTLKYLVVAMAASTIMPATQADTGGTGTIRTVKKVGDLEIYQAASGGKVTIMMMLDTSGSMGADSGGTSACDVPSSVTKTFVSNFSEPSNTTPSYTRRGCIYTGKENVTTMVDTKTYFAKEVKTTTTIEVTKKYSGSASRTPAFNWPTPKTQTVTITLPTTQTASSVYSTCGASGSTDKTKCTTSANSISTGGLTPESSSFTPTPTSTSNSTTEKNVTVQDPSNPSYSYTYAIPTVVITTKTTTTTETIYYYKMVPVPTITQQDVSVRFDDRLTKLKDAIFVLMNDPSLDEKKVSIGVGQFSSSSGEDNVANDADGRSGKILVKANLLDDAQRLKIKNQVAGLVAGSGTPTANAYATAGAYMLGETVAIADSPLQYQQYFETNINSTKYYFMCTYDQWDANRNCLTVTNTWMPPKNIDFTKLTKGPLVTGQSILGYGRADGYFWTTSENSLTGTKGYEKSVTDSKGTNNKFASPLSESSASCDGQGIYFLTDGYPNSSLKPELLMAKALGRSTFTVPTAGTATNSRTALENGNDTLHGMPQVGEFAKSLRIAANNPKHVSIRTAVVGFGSSFNLDNFPGLKIPNLPVVKTDPATGMPLIKDGQYQYKDGEYDTYYDCSKITNVDIRNACNWGAKTHPQLKDASGKPINSAGYGEGGFYSANKPEEILGTVKKFLGDLSQEINDNPSGTISVPDDPYKADSQMAIAYYPVLKPQVSKNPAIWAGNMKKYNLSNGTLWGKNNSRLFVDISGKLNANTEDMWSAANISGKNDSVIAGGVYSNLKAPTTAPDNVRTIYLEDAGTAGTGVQLRLFGVNSSGKITLDGNALSATNTFNDTTTYTPATIIALVKYLGFSLTPEQETADPITLTLTKPDIAVKISGATIHSSPSTISYSATLTPEGRVSTDATTRDDYVLYGSSDGALHFVDSDDYSVGDGGKEKFAFIPRKMLKDQLPALIPGGTSLKVDSNGKDNSSGNPYFGIDAPWLVAIDYIYDRAGNKVKVEDKSVDGTRVKGAFAYGGLRMGGEGIYGLDLTTANGTGDTAKPKLMFALDSTKAGFSRMGQIWSKPTKTRIKTSLTDTGTDVLVFGGGYDTCYEYENFQVGITDTTLKECSGKTEAKGNAIYIINAQNGNLIWSASSTAGATVTNADMKNSIVGGVTALDRNGDGFMDHLYFADLGGQVFRADFKNASATNSTFSSNRITTLLKNKYAGTPDAKYAYRFYERPVVSFYRKSGLFALVNVISGDRSSPLSKMRNDVTKSDRLYGIIDSDVTKKDAILYSPGFTPAISNLLDNNFAALPNAISGANTANPASITNNFDYSEAEKKATINTMATGVKKGWYYLLNRFDGFSGVKYGKGIGKAEVVGGQLFTTVYNPDMNYSSSNSCTAKIVGGSEREMYCLPYGICTVDDTGTDKDGNPLSKTGTAGFIRAGQGIQELTLGPLSKNQTSSILLIGMRTLAEQARDTRVNFNSDPNKKLGTESADGIGLIPTDIGADGKEKAYIPTGGGDGSAGTTVENAKKGGDGSGGPTLNDKYYVLTPKIWYETTK